VGNVVHTHTFYAFGQKKLTCSFYYAMMNVAAVVTIIVIFLRHIFAALF
jgi:hypothetical protein